METWSSEYEQEIFCTVGLFETVAYYWAQF